MAKTRTPNPTLHGLIIAHTLSGTVVRTLLFLLLTGAFIIAGSSVGSGTAITGGVGALALVAGSYLVFDLLYVVMANIRPLHPRLDRVVLPAALVFGLIAIYAPLFISQSGNALTGIWLTGGAILLLVLGTRFGLLIASSNK